MLFMRSSFLSFSWSLTVSKNWFWATHLPSFSPSSFSCLRLYSFFTKAACSKLCFTSISKWSLRAFFMASFSVGSVESGTLRPTFGSWLTMSELRLIVPSWVWERLWSYAEASSLYMPPFCAINF